MADTRGDGLGVEARQRDDAGDLVRLKKQLEGQVKSAKAELVRLQCQLRDFRTKHFKHMEHLRFLINNRLHAKEEDHPADQHEGSRHVPQGQGQAPVSKREIAPNPEQSTQRDIHTHADWKEPIQPIGYLKSCFKRKNGTPRQANLCPDSVASLQVTAFVNSAHSLEGLERFSHVWLLFYFHLNDNVAVKAKIRPPKLDGVRVGVMSTRSPHRPNPIGLSLVELAKVEGDTLHFRGIDLVDGTPILDVKPYIPFYDAPDEEPSIAPWVKDARKRELAVRFTEKAQADINNLVEAGHLEFFQSADAFKHAILAILRADPRSSYRRGKCQDQEYAFTLDAADIFAAFTDEGEAVVLRAAPFRHKKEKTAGHLSQDLDQNGEEDEPEADDAEQTEQEEKEEQEERRLV